MSLRRPYLVTRRAASGRVGSVLGLAASGYSTTILSLATAPLVARALGPAGRGEVAAALTFAALLSTLVSFGMPLAIGHAVGSRLVALGTARVAALRFSVAVTPLCVLTAWLLHRSVLSDLRGAAGLVAVGLVGSTSLSVLGALWSGLLLAEGALRPLSRLRLLPPALTTLGVVTLFVAGALTAASYLALILLIGLASLGMTYRYLPPHGKAGPVPWRHLLGYGSRASLGTLAGAANARVDQALLAAFAAPAQLGIYATAVTISLLPVNLALAISSRSFSLVVSASREGQAALVGAYVRLTLMASLLATGAVAAAAPIAVPLVFGEAFAGTVPILLVLLLGTIFVCISTTAGSCLTAVGRPGRNSMGDLVGLVITAGLLPPALAVGSLPLVAAVSVLSYGSVAVVQILLLRRAVGGFSIRPGIVELARIYHRLPLGRGDSRRASRPG